MEKPSVLFRADGNYQTGYGHVIRSLSVASMINEHFKCSMASIDPHQFIQDEISRIGECIQLSHNEHIVNFLDLIDKFDIVVLDGYHFDTEFQKKIKEAGKPLICIADLADKKYVSDVLINHAPGLDKEEFQVSENTKLCFGLEYAMLRPEFLTPKNISIENDSIFICFGGADQANITTKVAEIVQRMVNEKIIVVIGSGFRFQTELEEVINPSKVSVYDSVTAKKMQELIDQCSLAIVPASTILYEVLSRKLEAISGFYVDNQINIFEGFKREGLINPYGDFSNLKQFETYFANLYSQLGSSKPEIVIDGNRICRNYVELFKSLLKGV